MIKIIKAEEKHIPDIRKLWWEFIEYSAEIDPIFTIREGAEADFENKFLRPNMNNKNSRVLVALDGKHVVAYAVSQIQEDLKIIKSEIKTASIVHLFITKDFRRYGIGEKMYAETIKWLKSEGINRIELQVMDKNKSACSFWRKHGFKDFQHTWYREI